MDEKTILSVIATVFGVFVIANLILLNYTVFRVLPARMLAAKSTAPLELPNNPTPSTSPVDTCGTNCQRQVSVALAAMDAKLATLAAHTPKPSKVPVKTTPSPVPGAKEFFVPMGTGSTTKSDWEDVAGSDV